MTKRKVKAAGLKAVKVAVFKKGQRVKVRSGDFGNASGLVESVSGKNVTVYVHGRLTLTVPADNLIAL